MRFDQADLSEKIMEKIGEEVLPIYVENQLAVELNYTFVLHEDEEKKVVINVQIKPETIIKVPEHRGVSYAS